jgi:hypothetical protein
MSVGNCHSVRCFFALLTCVAFVSLSGCVILPEHGLLAGRGKIEEADIAFLKIGVTTREDVVLRFGEPDLVLFDQRVLAYYWAVSTGYFYSYLPSDGTFWRNYLFMLEFDDKGRLKRAEINSYSEWWTWEGKLEEWVKESENETISGQSFK